MTPPDPCSPGHTTYFYELEVLMRRFLFLVAVLILVFAAGCASSVQDRPFDASYDIAPSGDTNLQGISFTMSTHWMEEWHPKYGDSSYGDNMLKRYDDAEKDLNVHIGFTFAVDEPNWLLMALAAGLDVPDCMDAGTPTGLDWYRANILMPLSGISTIDYTDAKKYGPFNFIRYGIFSDVQPYGFYPWSWETVPQFSGVLLINSVHLHNAAVRDPYEMQENGIWNWEEYRKLLRSCADSLSGSETDIFPMNGGITFCVCCSLFSNGVEYVVKNGSSYGTGLTDEAAYSALEYVADLNRTGLLFYGTVNDFTDAQNSVFYLAESWVGTLFTEQVPSTAPNRLEEFGLMPFPYGPEGTPDTVSAYVNVGRRLCWTCALSKNDADDIGIIYDYLFEPFRNDYTYDVGWKDTAKTNVFHHLKDLENFIYMADHVRYDYSTQLRNFGPVSDAMIEVISGTKTAAAALDSVSGIIASEIESSITWVSDEIAW